MSWNTFIVLQYVIWLVSEQLYCIVIESLKWKRNLRMQYTLASCSWPFEYIYTLKKSCHEADHRTGEKILEYDMKRHSNKELEAIIILN